MQPEISAIPDERSRLRSAWSFLVPDWSAAALAAVLLLLSAPSRAADILVDASGGGDYLTIQEGVSHAVHGDTVWIADGDYSGAGNRNVDLAGKHITVRSVSDDPTQCVISMGSEMDQRAFYLHSGEGNDTVIRGLTIRNGLLTGGGYYSQGAGIFCEAAGPLITGCIFEDNAAPLGSGGGVYCSESAPVITDCLFVDNAAGTYGGGLYLLDCSATVERCRFLSNQADDGGGGLALALSSGSVTNCLVEGNWQHPQAPQGAGGGVALLSCDALRVESCTITDNSSPHSGGGLYCGNYSGVAAAGSKGSVLVANSLFWANDAPTGQDVNTVGGTALTLRRCSLQVSTCPGGLTCDECLLGLNPHFEPSSYRLAADSPCIDAATSVGGPAVDYDGDTRPGGCGPDIGADEYAGPGSPCWGPTLMAASSGALDLHPAGTCGRAGADRTFAMDTTSLVPESLVTASLSLEAGADFQVSLLAGCDGEADCLATDTAAASAVWVSGDLRVLVDGGEGTFSLDITCATPSPTPTPSAPLPATGPSGLALLAISLTWLLAKRRR